MTAKLIQKTDLHKYVVVDKSEAALDELNASLIVPKGVGDAIRKVLRKYSVSKKMLAIKNELDAVITYELVMNTSDHIYLKASYCPQKWLSGQNVFPLMSPGYKLAMKLDETVKLPFDVIAEKLGLENMNSQKNWVLNNKKYAMWNRFDAATYSGVLEDTEKVLDYFTGICGRVEHSKSRALGVARNLGFQYKSFYSKNSNVPCGITFSKMSGTTNVYHLTMYRKDLEIKDRAERKKATPFELGSLEMVKDRLRVEGHVLPQTFYRGRCKPFRDIFLGVGGGEGKPQKYWSSVQFLTDSEATVEKLKRCMAEMAYQLGIHLIFSAWSLDFVRGKIEGLVEKDAEREIFDKWCSHEDISTRMFDKQYMKVTVRKFAAKVEKLMGFNPCFVPATTFLWIQKGLYMSQLTEKEHTELIELETSRKTGSAKYAQIIDSAIDRAKDCRKSLREIRKGFLEFGEEPIGVVA